jgi:hypothetical protein
LEAKKEIHDRMELIVEDSRKVDLSYLDRSPGMG